MVTLKGSSIKHYSPQRRKDRKANYLFSFAAETPTNENHHAFGKLPEYHSFGDCALLAVKPAQRAWVYFFSPSQRKEIRTKTSAYSATLMTPAQAGGMSGEIYLTHLHSKAWTFSQAEGLID